MAGMGPPPKDPSKRARRNATVAMTKLPAEGRKGRAPKWPLINDVTLTVQLELAKVILDEVESQLDDDDLTPAKRRALTKQVNTARQEVAILDAKLKAQRKLEAELWGELWKTPQAVQWEKLQWTRDVAQYVRHKVLAELGSLDNAKEARQLADRLGLTPLSLLRLRWEIEDAPEASAATSRPKAKTKKRYQHLRVVAEQ